MDTLPSNIGYFLGAVSCCLFLISLKQEKTGYRCGENSLIREFKLSYKTIFTGLEASSVGKRWGGACACLSDAAYCEGFPGKLCRVSYHRMRLPEAGLHGGRMSLCPKWLFSDSFLRAGSWKRHRLVLSRLLETSLCVDVRWGSVRTQIRT